MFLKITCGRHSYKELKRVFAVRIAIFHAVLATSMVLACSPTSRDDTESGHNAAGYHSAMTGRPFDGIGTLDSAASASRVTCYEAIKPDDMTRCGTTVVALEHFDSAPIYWRASRTVLSGYGELANQISMSLDEHEGRISRVKELPPERFQVGLRSAATETSTEIEKLCNLTGARTEMFGREIGVKLIRDFIWMKYRLWLINPNEKFSVTAIDKLLNHQCFSGIKDQFFSEQSPQHLNSIYDIPPYFARPLGLYAYAKSRSIASARMWLLAALQEAGDEKDRCFERKLDRRMFKEPFTKARTHLMACIIGDAQSYRDCVATVNYCVPEASKPVWIEINR